MSKNLQIFVLKILKLNNELNKLLLTEHKNILRQLKWTHHMVKYKQNIRSN